MTLRNRRFLRKITPYSRVMMKLPNLITQRNAGSAPVAPPGLAPSSAPNRGGCTTSGERIENENNSPFNNASPPTHVTRDIMEPATSGDDASPARAPVPADDAAPTPEPAPVPADVAAPVPEPADVEGRPVRARKAPDRMNISREMQKKKSYATATAVLSTPSVSVGAKHLHHAGLGGGGGDQG